MKQIVMDVVRWICYHKRMFCAALLSGSALFLAKALWVFSYTDSSWFYYSSAATKQQTIIEMCGAHLASLLFFLFGGACILAIPLLLFIIYVLGTHKSWQQQWERVVAGISVMGIYAAILQYYFVDMQASPYPGGYVGYTFVHMLGVWFDQLGVIVSLYAMLFAAVVVYVRFSFMPIVHVLVQAMSFLSSRAFLQPIYTYSVGLFWVLSRPCVWFYQAIRELCRSETVHNQEGSILEFEQGIKQDKLQEDQFWQNYMQQPKIEHAVRHATQYAAQEHAAQDDSQDSIDDISEPREQDVCQTPPMHAYAQESALQNVEYQHAMPQEGIYTLPQADIFIGNQDERDDPEVMQYLQERAQMLEQKLERFGVSGKIVSIKRGPVVTLFEYQPDIDSKISKITSLEDDLALALQALSIRIIAPIPGKPFVGFEVSNKKRKDVLLAEMIHSPLFHSYNGSLPLALGQDTIGNNVMVDLARMPHLLIAGSTGSGKSVALNTMLISLLCKMRPDQLRLILIDPKRLEFAAYADIAHLLFPIVTHPKKAAPVLKWVVQQMEERYELMAKYGARSVQDFNHTAKQVGQDALPLIVVIIDELADLMMTTGREIEDLIARITQMARAAGIHLIVATQRPSVDVITGLIKVNFPSRISFRVTSKIDSRTILDCGGADKLLGRGDMLFLDSNDASLKRLHGAYVSDHEIAQVVSHIKGQQEVQYLNFDHEIQHMADEDRDDMYEEVLEYLEEIDEISISLLQRKFRIGYNRSARIIDMLEAEGLISASGNSKTRSVIR